MRIYLLRPCKAVEGCFLKKGRLETRLVFLLTYAQYASSRRDFHPYNVCNMLQPALKKYSHGGRVSGKKMRYVVVGEEF